MPEREEGVKLVSCASGMSLSFASWLLAASFAYLESLHAWQLMSSHGILHPLSHLSPAMQAHKVLCRAHAHERDLSRVTHCVETRSPVKACAPLEREDTDVAAELQDAIGCRCTAARSWWTGKERAWGRGRGGCAKVEMTDQRA